MIDVFDHPRSGLVVAEIELPSADTPFELPRWAGEEVTDDPGYGNSELSRRAREIDAAAIEHQRPRIVRNIAVVGKDKRDRLHNAFTDNRHRGAWPYSRTLPRTIWC